MERLMISTGKTGLAMVTEGIGAVINIILDPIFIFTLGMGIKGAAVATVIGQIAAFIVGIILNAKYNTDIKLSFKGFRPDGKTIGKIYAIGIPSIVMASIGSVMNVMFNRVLDGFTELVRGAELTVGQLAQTAFGVYFKLQSFIFMPVFGLNNGIVPIVAFNYGAQKRRRMTKTVRLGITYAVGYMALGLLAFQLFPELLLGFFNSA
jgi:Na+-driven multidrug efflux pump